MPKENINLNKFGKSLNTRALADEIFLPIQPGADLMLDFSEVQDASPSFCHEMLTVLKEKATRINFVNVNAIIKTQISKAQSSLAEI